MDALRGPIAAMVVALQLTPGPAAAAPPTSEAPASKRAAPQAVPPGTPTHPAGAPEPGAPSLPIVPPGPAPSYSPPPYYAPPYYAPPYYAPPYYAPAAGYLGTPLVVDLVSTEPDVALLVFAEAARSENVVPPLECAAPPCRALLPAGRYKIQVTESASTVAGSRVIELRGSSVVTVDPDTSEHRSAGLAMGIAGPILTLVGVGLLLSTSCYDCANTSRNEERATFGGLLLLGGLTITPIGWVMFGTSFKPEVEVRPLGSR